MIYGVRVMRSVLEEKQPCGRNIDFFGKTI
jgi:uncharacterized protein YicC (UPF0701 family)